MNATNYYKRQYSSCLSNVMFCGTPCMLCFAMNDFICVMFVVGDMGVDDQINLEYIPG